MFISKNRRSQYLSTLSVIGLMSLASLVGSSINSYADTAGDGSAGFTTKANSCSTAGGNSGGGATGGSTASTGSPTLAPSSNARAEDATVLADVITPAQLSKDVANKTIVDHPLAALRISTEPMALSVFNSGPAAAVDQHGNVSVFFNDGQLATMSQVYGNNINQGFFKPNTTTQITNTATHLFMASDPVAANNKDGSIDAFWLGSDGNVWWTYQTGFDPNTGEPTWCAPAALWTTAQNTQKIQLNNGANTIVTNPLPVLGADLIAAETALADATAGINTKPNVAAHDTGGSAIKVTANDACGETATVANICVNATGGAVFSQGEPGIQPASNVAATLVNGKVFLAYIGTDWNIWTSSQTAVNATDNPNAFTFPGVISRNDSWPTGHINFVTNADHTKAVAFYRSFDRDPVSGNVGSIWQVPVAKNATATKVISTGSAVQPVVSSNVTGWFNQDGTVEIVWRGSEGGLWHSWSTNTDVNNLTWSPPWQLGETGHELTSDPTVAINADGWPQVFYRTTNGDVESIIRLNWTSGLPQGTSKTAAASAAPQGQWANRTDLTNAAFNTANGHYVDSVVSPIAVVADAKKCKDCLQLFFEGGQQRLGGGAVNNAKVNTNGGTTTLASAGHVTAHDVGGTALKVVANGCGEKAATSSSLANIEATATAENNTAVAATLADHLSSPHALWTTMQFAASSNPDPMKADPNTGFVATGWTVPSETGGTTAHPAIATDDACNALLSNAATDSGGVGAFSANAVAPGATTIAIGGATGSSGSWGGSTGTATATATPTSTSTAGQGTNGTATTSALPANPVQPAGTGGGLPPGWAL